MPPARGYEDHGPRQAVGRAERPPASGPIVGPTTVDMTQALVLMERPPGRQDDLAPVSSSRRSIWVSRQRFKIVTHVAGLTVTYVPGCSYPAVIHMPSRLQRFVPSTTRGITFVSPLLASRLVSAEAARWLTPVAAHPLPAP